MAATLVSRERLLDSLDESLDMPLTLVSAPAGYGKSVLVGQWVAQQEHSTFWLSLDANDSDPRRFLAYLIACINKAFPQACKSTQDLLWVREHLPAQLFARHLLNDLNELGERCTIVLDDYHHLHTTSLVHELLDNVFGHPPPQIHFILITRRDPPLRLAQLRALNRMFEMRLQDLQFSRLEAKNLLAASTGYAPGEEAVTNLQREVEGWAVGLRLVALALRHSSNPDEFLQSLHGGLPQIKRYLMNEVLSGLSPGFRDTLLKASILNRFCVDLIEYVCGPDSNSEVTFEPDAVEFMHELRKSNLFAISLDQKEHWFRFHHLFQELLQRELSRNLSKQEIARVHLRASYWFETEGEIDEAIEHAVEADDTLFAARIVEKHCYRTMEADKWYVLESWLSRIPESVKQKRLALLVAQTWVAVFSQQLEKIASLLADMDALHQEEEVQESLLGEIDFFRGYALFWEGAVNESIRLVERSSRRTDRHKSVIIAEIDLHLAVFRYMNDQCELATQGIDEAIRESGGIQLARRIGALAFIQMLSGDLHGAQSKARQMRTMGAKMRSPLTDAWSDYFSACADFHHMELDAATTKFQTIVERPYLIDERAALDSFAGLALAQQLLRQPSAANDTVDSLMKYVSGIADSEGRAVAESCQARIRVMQGHLQEAARWEQTCRGSPGPFDLFLWVEPPVITRVRVLLALASGESLAKAQGLIDEIQTVNEACRFVGQSIGIAVLQTLVFAKQGRNEAALDALRHAVTLGEPGGWIRPFVEPGPQMLDLLLALREKGDALEYINRLITAFGAPSVGATGSEVLTNRELDILDLLAKRLQNKEIAARLFISTHTVKDHLKHIYQKLDVGDRRQAVSAAIKIGSIPPP